MTQIYQSLSVKPREVYRDIDLSLRVNPVTGDILLKSTEESIKQAVKNLVLTNFYERPFEPTVGSNLVGSLFENYTIELEVLLRIEIARVIRAFEPRVSIKDVQVGYDGQETIRARVSFLILGQVKDTVLDLIFQRVR